MTPPGDLLTMGLVVTLDSGYFPSSWRWKEGRRKQSREAPGTLQAGVQSITGTIDALLGPRDSDGEISKYGAGRRTSPRTTKLPRAFARVSRSSPRSSAMSPGGRSHIHASPLHRRNRFIFQSARLLRLHTMRVLFGRG